MTDEIAIDMIDIDRSMMMMMMMIVAARNQLSRYL